MTLSPAGTPPPLDLAIDAGDPFDRTVSVVDALGLAVAISGWTARAQVRAAWRDTAVLYEWSTVIGNATVGATSVRLVTPAVVTATWQDWPNLRAVWDLYVYEPDLTPHRIVPISEVRIGSRVTR